MIWPMPRHNVPLSAAEVYAAIARPSDGARAELERDAAHWLGAKHAIAVSSGRSALGLALASLELPEGAPVIVPEYAFYAVPAVVRALGFELVPAPIDPRTFALDPRALEKLAPRAAAIVMILPFGQTGDLDRVTEISERCGVPLVEDASQSIGARLDGRRVGTFGRAGVFSLVSGKNVQGFGGGLFVTNDAALAARARARVTEDRVRESGVRRELRAGLVRSALSTRAAYAALVWGPSLLFSHAAPDAYLRWFHEAEVEFDRTAPVLAMADAQAAVARESLRRADARNAIRRRNAERLTRKIADLPLELGSVHPRSEPSWNAVAARVRNGPRLTRRLLRHGVDVRQDYMGFVGPRRFVEDVIYLPNHPGLSESDMDRIAGLLRSLL